MESGAREEKMNGKARTEAMICGERYRITVLTPYLVRLEYSERGEFTDAPTQVVVNREFDVPPYRCIESEEELQVVTEGLRLTYDKRKFSPEGLRIDVCGRYEGFSAVWHYGDEPRDLRGTARTLDEANGAIPLGHGVLSKFGFSLIDDKGSCLIGEDGWVCPRRDAEAEDIYFFGYGRDYLACLKDYYKLTGGVPLLPKYAFGNWWSRYYRYTQKGYEELIERFEREDVPFTVAVIDMDWHITEVDPKYGTGWTGYTWNRELFPDPDAFMRFLHGKGLKVTLNVHPADGVRAYEECYAAFAKYMGADAERGDPVAFRPADKKFMEGYFSCVHHPLERRGVDFWWIDWQQGGNSGVKGLDPLWLLNHCHYLDSCRDGRRGLIFSRYAGPGSHRYPTGFSGDTVISWESLDFQPYFTATASNIGYGWWSHDIGGHMLGVKDDELEVRWFQLGVFSPILRLHSTCSEFNGKEPWRYNRIAEEIMKGYLRLRHRLIPYLNCMNYRAAFEGVPLVQPMYYAHPMEEVAYSVPNEYYFGSELLVCPITRPRDRRSGMAQFDAWLPEGRWADLFTGLIYSGGRRMTLNRETAHVPVFLREGGILPLDGRKSGNALDNPAALEIHAFLGKSGAFTLREDEGDGYAACAETTFSLSEEDGRSVFTIGAARGNLSVLPQERTYRIFFRGVAGGDVSVTYGGAPTEAFEREYDAALSATVICLTAEIGQEVKIAFANVCRAKNDVVGRTFAYLNRAEIPFALKEQMYAAVKKAECGQSFLKIESELRALRADGAIVDPVLELLEADA